MKIINNYHALWRHKFGGPYRVIITEVKICSLVEAFGRNLSFILGLNSPHKILVFFQKSNKAALHLPRNYEHRLCQL
jgi:hypothetical protein